MSEWRPIETAPKDGTHILAAWQCLNKTWDMDVVLHSDGVWCTYYLDATHEPSHWMPLPDPPQLDEND